MLQQSSFDSQQLEGACHESGAQKGEAGCCGCWVQYEISAAALEVLQSTTDAKGRKLEVYKVPLPPNLFITQEEADGLTVCSSQLPAPYQLPSVPWHISTSLPSAETLLTRAQQCGQLHTIYLPLPESGPEYVHLHLHLTLVNQPCPLNVHCPGRAACLL